MSAWKTVQLTEVASVFNGKTPSKSEQRAKGHPVLKIKDVSELGEYRGKFESFVDPELASKFADKHVQKGDTLILNAAHNADYVASKTYRAEPPTFGALATGEWLIVRPVRDSLDADFAHHWVNTTRTRRALRDLVNGIHLYPKDVARLRIPLPPLEEQQRVAAVLGRAEALRTKRRAALAQLDTLTQAIYINLFGEPVTNPKGSQIESLGEYLLFVTSGGRGWAKFYGPKGSRFIRSLDVRMNHFGNEDVVFVTPPDNAEARRTRVMAGDVLLTITGSRIGRVAPVPCSLTGAYVSQHVAILRADRKYIEADFLSFFLSLEAGGQRQIAKAQYGQTKPGLNFEQIRRFQVPVPPLPMQREFTRRVAAVEKLKAAHRASVAELGALFASLQHRAFRGEL